MIIPVILSGGSGTRLWPLSREAYPKQFLPLSNEHSLFQNTIMRLDGLAVSNPLVVCNEEHRFLVSEQMAQLGVTPAGILLEPVGRNTAPAIACAAFHAIQQDTDPVLLVMPSDHVIKDKGEFQSCVRLGETLAQDGALITFGISPDRAETGYGYIRRAAGKEDARHYPVSQFTEKPDAGTAASFIASGDYFWNSGIFMFQADRYLEALAQYRLDIFEASQAAYQGMEKDNAFLRLDTAAFSQCPAESVDYAVMEKTDDAVVIPMNAGWSDLGAWPAMRELIEADEHGNIIMGDVITHNASNNYIRGSRRLVSALGMSNTIIIETADAVLVADQAHAQDVKEIVRSLKAQSRDEAIHHVCVYRPWGSFETVDEGPGFKVKRLVVKPGASLSLQLHRQRAEHWVVVRGVAQVTKGDEVFTLQHDESTYIPMETRHRLENPGSEPLEIIEVQTGGYLGEDDIERFDDIYGR